MNLVTLKWGFVTLIHKIMEGPTCNSWAVWPLLQDLSSICYRFAATVLISVLNSLQCFTGILFSLLEYPLPLYGSNLIVNLLTAPHRKLWTSMGNKVGEDSVSHGYQIHTANFKNQKSAWTLLLSTSSPLPSCSMPRYSYLKWTNSRALTKLTS